MNLLYANDQKGRHAPSWYAETAIEFPAQPDLRGARRADVCVVGGGYTGLSAALHLAERGYDVAVLEAQRIGGGASGRNGGQVGTGQRLEQQELEQRFGTSRARMLWEMAEEAKALVKHLIFKHEIPVTFYPGIVHACWHDHEVAHAHESAAFLARNYGYEEITPLDRDAIGAIIPSGVFKGGDIDRDAGALHPLNYALGLARACAKAGVRFYEGAEVREIVHGARPKLRTDKGEIDCDHVILAANGYLGNLEPTIAARVMPINNFIVATEPLEDRVAEVLTERVAVADTKFVVNYWRLSEDNRLLFGGAESYGYRFPDIVKAVQKPLYEIYPALKNVAITHAWGGTLAITRNRLPCFARVAPNVLSASGYSGHGVAIATLAGKLMAEATMGQAERFDVMESIPSPAFPGGAALRWPLLVAAMTWFSLRDRLGK